jgi:hypothetical protein
VDAPRTTGVPVPSQQTMPEVADCPFCLRTHDQHGAGAGKKLGEVQDRERRPYDLRLLLHYDQILLFTQAGQESQEMVAQSKSQSHEIAGFSRGRGLGQLLGLCQSTPGTVEGDSPPLIADYLETGMFSC